jgi:hypothetical protein
MIGFEKKSSSSASSYGVMDDGQKLTLDRAKGRFMMPALQMTRSREG